MGFATNLGEIPLKIFTRSLRNIYSPDECELVLITNRYESYFGDVAKLGVRFSPTYNNYTTKTRSISKAINRLAIHSTRTLKGSLGKLAPEIFDSYRAFIENWHHPHFVRWFAYERFLSLNRHYDQVLLADVKDVVFQSPFFSEEQQLCLCDQAIKYGETFWDTKWYREAYGEKALKGLLGRSPFCIGTMMGPHREILSIVRELCDEFSERPFNRVEQAVFNHLIFSNQIKTPYTVLQNVTGPIVTLASDEIAERYTTDRGIIRRRSDGSAAAVVHMYDRFHPMLEEVTQRLLS